MSDKDMTIAQEIYDALIEADNENPFTPDLIADILYRRLHTLLCIADGQLSAIRHGRVIEDHELEETYYKLRDAAKELEGKQ